MTSFTLSPAEKAKTLLSSIKLMRLVAPEFTSTYSAIIDEILSLKEVRSIISNPVPNGRGSEGYNRRLTLNLAALLYELGVLYAPRSLTELGRLLNNGRRTEDTISYNCPRCYPTQLTPDIIRSVKEIVSSYKDMPFCAA